MLVPSETIDDVSEPDAPSLLKQKMLAWSVLLFAVLIFYWRSLVPLQDFILRDTGRYYMQYYRLVQDEWSAGRIPLWTPYDNSGTPLLANPCTAVFYPVKLLFLLPFSFEDDFKIFILFHVVLTMVTMWRLARNTAELGVIGATLATLGYCFSSPVIYGYCNLPFLCSAAWLPLALEMGIGLLQPQHKSVARNIILLASCLTMMVLCGDPQTAYHVGLLLGLALMCGVGLTSSSEPSSIITTSLYERTGSFLNRNSLALKYLGIAVVLAGVLSAIQILPTMEYNSFSVRSASRAPESVWGIPSYWNVPAEYRVGTRWYDAMIGSPPPPAKHSMQIYSFSFSPLKLLESVLPGCTGTSILPGQRWLAQLGGEDPNVWFPQVYFGLMSLILALSVMRFWQGNSVIKWASWLVVLSLIASWGSYGLVYYGDLLLRMTGMISRTEPLYTGGGVGGLYWLLVTLLPGYDGFRFPAKWLVFTALGMSLLAGYGLEKWHGREPLSKLIIRLSFMGLGCAWLALIVIVVLALIGNIDLPWNPWSTAGNSVWQPLYLGIVRGCCLWTVWNLVLMFQSRLRAEYLLHFQWGMIGLALADLWLVNGACIEVGKREIWDQPSAVAAIIHTVDDDPLSVKNVNLPPRYHRPEYFIQHDRQLPPDIAENPVLLHAYQLRDERNLLAAFMHIQSRLCSVHQYVTIDHEAYEAMFDPVPLPQVEVLLQPRRAYDMWGTQYFVLHRDLYWGDPAKSILGLEHTWGPEQPSTDYLPQGPKLSQMIPDSSTLHVVYPQLQVLRNTDALPYARVVHHVETMAPIAAKDLQRRMELYLKLFLGIAGGVDHQHSAVVETVSPEKFASLTSPSSSNELNLSGEKVSEAYYDPQRIVIDVDLQQPGMLIMSDLFYPGWVCSYRRPDQLDQTQTTPVEIERVNHLQRGVLLPQAGKYAVTFEYLPSAFNRGAWISIAGFLALAIWLLIKMSQKLLLKKS
jgi:hypothetical protein